jgi:hypothetical protein
MKKLPLLFTALLLAVVPILFGDSGAASASLPKGPSIAVLVKGAPAHAAAARSILVRALLDEGYRAVDEQQLERIRQNKAASLALEGDVDAILQLGKTFGFSVLLSGHVSVPQPVRNEFGLFTATATVSATACTASNARQIAAGTASAKEIGYTAAEAAQKAAESAVRAVVPPLLGSASGQEQESPGMRFRLIVFPVRSFAEAHALAASCREAGANNASVARFSAGNAEIDVEYGGPARSFLTRLLGLRKDLREESVEGSTLRLAKE